MSTTSAIQLDLNPRQLLEEPPPSPEKAKEDNDELDLERPPSSGVLTSGDHYSRVWRKVIEDDAESEDLFAELRESCRGETWTELGFKSFPEYCEKCLGTDAASVSAILKRRFGQHLYRLLTVRPARQGERNDLAATSSNDREKCGPRMDTTVRATLVAIERAPQLERLLEQGLLPWDLGAKLGKEKLTAEQIEGVRTLGNDVSRLLTLEVKEAKAELRQAVAAITGQAPSPITKLSRRLAGLQPDELRDALLAIPVEVLRQALPPGLLRSEPEELPSPLPEPIPEQGGDADPKVIPYQARGGAEVSVERHGAAGDSLDHKVDSDPASERPVPVAEEHDVKDEPPTTEPALDGQVGGRSPGGGNVGLGDLEVPRSEQFPDWTMIDNATEVDLDVEIRGVQKDAVVGARKLVMGAGVNPTLNALMGPELATFYSKTVNRTTKDLAALAAEYGLRPFNKAEGAPPGATAVVCFADPRGFTGFVGFERFTLSGQLPDELVLAVKDAYERRMIIRDSRTSDLFGTVLMEFVQEASARVVASGPDRD